ncbi:MAG: LptF/LptG family permease [Planctomycetota bacterium]|nr:LptF/LptG family permease [Planctomycetota bacterium]
MLTIFDRYVTRILVAHYAGASCVLFGIFISVDTLYHIDTLSKAEEGLLRSILLYWAGSLPQVFVTLAPVAFVAGAISTLTLLKRRNELTAYLCAGSSLWRLLFPFFVMSLVSAIFMLTVDLTMLDNATDIRGRLRTDRAVKRLVLPDPNGYILRFSRFYPATKKFDDVTLIFQNAEGQVTKKIQAKEGLLLENFIELKGCVLDEYAPSGNPLSIGKVQDLIHVRTNFKSKDFEVFEQDIESLSLLKLAQLIRVKPHLPHLRTNFYARIALMMANFVLLLVCLPFALGVLGKSTFLNLGVTMLFCLLYFIVSLLFWQLGARGQLAPVSAAWLPNLLFVSLGAAIIDLVPT